MQRPAQVTFDGFERSAKLEERINERIAKLEQFSENIVGCRVAIETEHRHKRNGRRFHVRIVLSVPGKELVVSQDRHNRAEHEDPYVAVRDAFNSMTRQLEDWERIHRGDVKHHEPSAPAQTDESDSDER